jgi:tetratricopeptide (TPR) repeat protein
MAETSKTTAEPEWRNELSGTVHGPAVQAQTIHGGVHFRVDVPPPPSFSPAQLPPPPPNFTNRTQELATLDQHLTEHDPTHPPILVITGIGGVGKTALALRWLHQVNDHYPGGSLHTDLSGHTPRTARRPTEVLTGFLRALGVPAEQIPLALSDQSALFRSVTSGRHLIILLDNAVSAAQVRALLPAPPSLVVVTTRRRITGLAIDGAHFVEVGPLGEDAGLDLLSRILGQDRVAREPAQARSITTLCGNLPLAVCVCAARLALHPHWRIAKVAAELADEHERLTKLSLAGDASVRAAFDLSYRALPKPAGRLYRLAALLPGPDFTAELAAAALQTSLPAATAMLETLTDASLLDEFAQQRFRFHDLTRLHAAERARDHSAHERRAVLTAAVDWYLRRAVAADMVIIPLRWRLNPMYDQARQSPPAYPQAAQALNALEADLPGVLAAVRTANAEGLHEQAWQLCEATWGLCMNRKLFGPWISLHLAGLPSAQACGDRRAQARMSVQLGVAYQAVGRLADATALFTQALELGQEDGHQIGIAIALEQLGLADLARGHPDDAIGRFTQARATFQELGRPRGVTLMTRRIGEAHTAADRPGQAIPELQQASTQFAALHDDYMQARTLTSLAQAHLAAGQPAQAGPSLDQALATMIALGSHHEQALIHAIQAGIARHLGDRGQERRCLEQAFTAYSAAGAADAEVIRLRLDELARETEKSKNLWTRRPRKPPNDPRDPDRQLQPTAPKARAGPRSAGPALAPWQACAAPVAAEEASKAWGDTRSRLTLRTHARSTTFGRGSNSSRRGVGLATVAVMP